MFLDEYHNIIYISFKITFTQSQKKARTQTTHRIPCSHTAAAMLVNTYVSWKQAQYRQNQHIPQDELLFLHS